MQRRKFSTGFLLGTLATALGMATLPACAHVEPPPAHPGTRVGGLAILAIVDRDSGMELPVYRHRGDWWVAGTPGRRYAIRLRNSSGGRLMAVMSVDGVNVVSGETAAFGQTGYVFGASEGSDIAGWRKSDAQIAAFEFTSLGDSYANRTGRPANVGVIGVALFRERWVAPPVVPPSVPFPYGRTERYRDSEQRAQAGANESASAPASKSAAANAEPSTDAARADVQRQEAPAPRLGTAHGERESSYVGRTRFERAQATPDEVIRIRYDSRENLVAAGIIAPPPPRWPRPATPVPFPDSNGSYVPDPPRRY
ncbi:MAG: hypothetical protein ABIW85_00135 [Variovorax sp.]